MEGDHGVGRGELKLLALYRPVNLDIELDIGSCRANSAKKIDEPGFGTKLWASFRNGWLWIGEVLIGIISVWPLFLVVFICWILYRKTRTAKIKQA